MATSTGKIDQKQKMINRTKKGCPKLHYRAMAVRDMLKRSWDNWKKHPKSLGDSCFNRYGKLDLAGRMWALKEAGLSELAEKFQREEGQPDDASDDEGDKDLATTAAAAEEEDDSDVEEIVDPHAIAALSKKSQPVWTNEMLVRERIDIACKFLRSDAEDGIYAVSLNDPVFTACGSLTRSQRLTAVRGTGVRQLWENFGLIEKDEDDGDDKENVDAEEEKEVKKKRARGPGRPRKDAVEATKAEAEVPIHQSIRRPRVVKKTKAVKPKAKPRTKKAKATEVEAEASMSTVGKEDEDERPKKRARRNVAKED
ncbi:hypothetical protein ONZ45_g8919 [Pleurotus djamor]|nr:hypothetical protein ONZ45_g8919 [Pleurotus djamor]